MRDESVQFFSDGLRLSGGFFWPDGQVTHPRPLVIACSGFTGLMSIHPARFARFLTGRGRACFGFDYRGFADSGGQRGRVLLEEQVRDILHACAFASADPRVAADRVFLLGWGMGAGLVLDAARALPGVAGVIAVNGFYCGERVQRAHRGEQGLRAFRERVDAERARRAATGRAEMVDPFEIYPLDAQSREYVDAVLRKTPNYEAERYSMELADSLLRWNPQAYASKMRIPLLLAHGTENRLHPPAEAESLYAAYGGPKSLYFIEGAGHTEFMHDEDPRFQALAERIADWLDERLGR
jgi:alpha-beta hydrolase superfamily lysophospholipase